MIVFAGNAVTELLARFAVIALDHLLSGVSTKRLHTECRRDPEESTGAL